MNFVTSRFPGRISTRTLVAAAPTVFLVTLSPTPKPSRTAWRDLTGAVCSGIGGVGTELGPVICTAFYLG